MSNVNRRRGQGGHKDYESKEEEDAGMGKITIKKYHYHQIIIIDMILSYHYDDL